MGTYELEQLSAAVDALLDRHCPPEIVAAAEGDWNPRLWSRLAAVGFTSVGVPESLGGSGGGLAEAATVVRTAARYAAPVPLAETLLVAAPLLVAAGLPCGSGPVTVAIAGGEEAPVLERNGRGWSLDGLVRRVPWARVCERLLVAVPTSSNSLTVAVVRPERARLRSDHNLAGEPRDEVSFQRVALADEDVRELPGFSADDLLLRGALSRVVLTAGALERTLALSCEYARQREQFGRPIAKFQAVKQLLARLAGEVGAGVAAAEGAVAGAQSERAPFVIAAAKVRAARAASHAAQIAHQVHGALGVTREHQMQHFTRRLWSWRDEYGAQGEWERRLGRMALRTGADAFWPTLAG